MRGNREATSRSTVVGSAIKLMTMLRPADFTEANEAEVPVEELAHPLQVELAKDISMLLQHALSELEKLSRAAIIEAASNLIAHYQRQAALLGVEHPELVNIEQQMDVLLSLLTDDERQEAITHAAGLMDENSEP